MENYCISNKLNSELFAKEVNSFRKGAPIKTLIARLPFANHQSRILFEDDCTFLYHVFSYLNTYGYESQYLFFQYSDDKIQICELSRKDIKSTL